MTLTETLDRLYVYLPGHVYADVVSRIRSLIAENERMRGVLKQLSEEHCALNCACCAWNREIASKALGESK